MAQPQSLWAVGRAPEGPSSLQATLISQLGFRVLKGKDRPSHQRAAAGGPEPRTAWERRKGRGPGQGWDRPEVVAGRGKVGGYHSVHQSQGRGLQREHVTQSVKRGRPGSEGLPPGGTSQEQQEQGHTTRWPPRLPGAPVSQLFAVSATERSLLPAQPSCLRRHHPVPGVSFPLFKPLLCTVLFGNNVLVFKHFPNF